MDKHKPFGDREALNSVHGCCGAPDDPLGTHEIHDPHDPHEPLYRDSFLWIMGVFALATCGFLWWSFTR